MIAHFTLKHEKMEDVGGCRMRIQNPILKKCQLFKQIWRLQNG